MNVVSFFNLDVAGCCGTKLGASEEGYALRSRLSAGAERFGIDLGDTLDTIEPWRLRAAGLVATQGILELARGE